MAIYEYRCERHGLFELMRPGGTAPETAPCPACGSTSTRVLCAPMVLGRNRAWSSAIERAEKSRHEPEVVTSVPSAGARRRSRMAPANPAFRTLPRP